MREASRLSARLAHRRLPGTKTAFDQRPQLTSPTFVIEYPRPHLERRVMAHVPLMPASELGDPKTVLVPVETNDRTLHVLHGTPERGASDSASAVLRVFTRHSRSRRSSPRRLYALGVRDVIVHIVHRADWERAQVEGAYVSHGFGEDGFIHMSRPDQAHFPANAIFSEKPELVLLWIDVGQLNHPLRWERADDSPIAFPHLYGPLNLDAVVGVTNLQPWKTADFVLPPQPR
jgi:uncharacterized protein (DUF952 family)